jgi:hypothetical protein
MKWTIFIGDVVVAISVLLLMVCALSFKWLRKRRLRRSPLQGRQIGHLPGQQLLARISYYDEIVSESITLMMLALPMMFMLWLTLRVDWQKQHFGLTEGMLLFGALAMFAWEFRAYTRAYQARENYRDGWTAEQVTGMQLNRLVAQGCLVLHDLPAEYGNIDHVVIAPRGIYAVETKSFRKPRNASDHRDDPSHQVQYNGKTLLFPDFATREPIEQAIRQAQWLRRTLRDALGREVPVVPIVALPGWYVKRSEAGKRADVQVFTPMGKGAEFMAWESECITPDQRRLIAEMLAARYPVIDA